MHVTCFSFCCQDNERDGSTRGMQSVAPKRLCGLPAKRCADEWPAFLQQKEKKNERKKRFNTFEEKIIKILVSLYAVLDIYHQFSTHDIRYKSTEHHGRRIFQDLTALCFQW